MASSGAGLAAAVCCEKVTLAQDCVEALHELAQLEDERLSVLMSGGEWDLFNAELQRARDKMDEAKKRYLSHIESHGC